MIRKFIIRYAIALLVCVAWWVVYYYRHDDIADKIELLFGVGTISAILTGAVVFLPVPLLIYGALAERKYWRRKHRKALERCVDCGYDLRGSKERCPECGREFESFGV